VSIINPRAEFRDDRTDERGAHRAAPELVIGLLGLSAVLLTQLFAAI
jgi:hypothetical protein